MTPLWILVALFGMPVIAAWFFYLNPEYLPENRVNRGEILERQVPLDDDLGLADSDGVPFDLTPLDGKWTLVALEQPPCGEDCRQRAVTLRQIRLAVGESRYSVERLVVFTAPTDTTNLAADFDGMHIAFANAAVWRRLRDGLGQGDAALGRLYIRDPMGNLMMRYAPDAPGADTLKDMERLLKASKNWIKGASYGHR
jgi:hypothetical protein